MEHPLISSYTGSNIELILYDDIIFKEWVAKIERVHPDFYIIKVKSNDTIFYYPYEDLEDRLYQNIATGSVFTTVYQYINILKQYYSAIFTDKKTINDMIIKYAKNTISDISIIQNILDKKDLPRKLYTPLVTDDFDEFVRYGRNILVSNATINSSELTILYSNIDAPITLSDFTVNSTFVVVYLNGIYRIYEDTDDLESLFDILQKSRGDENINVQVFLDGKYRSGVYILLNNELIISDTDWEEFEFKVDIPSKYYTHYMSNVTMEFSIYDFKLDIELFAYAIMTKKPLSRYLQISEENNPYMLQSNYQLKIREINSGEKWIRLTLNMHQISSNITVKTIPFGHAPYWNVGDSRLTDIKTGSYVVNCVLINAESEFSAYSTMWRFITLLGKYQAEYANTTLKLYKDNIPNFTPSYISTIRKLENRESILQQLQRAAPDVFVEGYAKKCQVPGKQPTVLTDAELDAWKKKTQIENPKLVNQFIKFPHNPAPDQHVINLICNDKIYKHPGVKPNLDLINRDKYPYIPCCYSHDQINKKDSNWTRYISDVEIALPEEEEVIGIRHELQTVNRPLDIGRSGKLPSRLAILLESYDIAPRDTLFRIGAFKGSNNVFLHCIMNALSSTLIDSTGVTLPYNININKLKTYSDSTTPNKRELFIQQWRLLRSGKDTPDPLIDESDSPDSDEEVEKIAASCSQELYNYDINQIIDLIGDLDVPFDSLILYHMVELYFDINIVVFYLPPHDNSLTGLEIPIHKEFHVREPRYDKPTIILFKHYGGKELPHYEIIGIDRGIESFETLRFQLVTVNKTKNIYRLFNDLYSISYITKDRQNKIALYKNVYNSSSVFSYLSQHPYINIVSQILDSHGKTRGYTITVPYQNRIIKGTIICFPQQPRHLPITNEIYRFPYSMVIRMFGNNSITRKHINNDKLTGIWLAIYDEEFGLYIPVITPSSTIDIQHSSHIMSDSRILHGSNPLIPIYTSGDYSKWKTNSIYFDTFLEVISYLFYSYIRNYPNTDYNKLLEIFKSTIIMNTKTDKYYLQDIDMDKLSNLSLSDAYKYIQKVTRSTLVKGKKIYIGSEKLYDNIIYFIDKFLGMSNPDKIMIPTSKGDVPIFNYRELYSIDELESWIYTKLGRNDMVLEGKDINILRREPYLYRGWTLFIIQNVKDGDKQRALNVADTWNNDNVNLGYYASSGRVSDFTIYQLLNDEVVLESTKDTNIRILRILDKYCALLKLI